MLRIACVIVRERDEVQADAVAEGTQDGGEIGGYGGRDEALVGLPHTSTRSPRVPDCGDQLPGARPWSGALQAPSARGAGCTGSSGVAGQAGSDRLAGWGGEDGPPYSWTILARSIA